MAASKAELWTMLANACKLADNIWKFGASNTPNYLGLEDTLIQSLEGSQTSAVTSALQTLRGGMAGLYESNVSVISPILLELARIGYSSVEDNVLSALKDIRDGMAATTPTPETVSSRAWTYGSVAATAGNVGTGTVYRLTVDEDEYSIENGSPVGGIVKIQCTSDKNAGETSGQEKFKVFGSGQMPIDALELGTIMKAVKSDAIAMRAVDGKLTNSSFDDLNDTLTTTESGWDLSAAASFEKVITDYYRVTAGSSTGVALRFKDNGSITQYINEQSILLDPAYPTFLIVRYKRETSCDGTLTIRLGSQTTALTFSSESGWNDIVVGTGTSKKGWYKNWKEDSGGLGARVSVTLASRTTGTLLVDEIILAQPFFFDGKYYLVTAGATDFLEDDSFTFTDTVANTGRIQYTLSRLFGYFLPHTSGTPTYADA